MTIDREQVKNTFKEYTDRYDSTEAKIALKIFHTYKVAEIAEDIAKSLNLSDEDVDIAWLLGMLHDIGRFEQVKRYNTFSDAQSVNHAKFGCELLFEQGLVRDYIEDDSQDELINLAIKNHNEFRIEEGLDERTEMFCNILRDADKVDILRVQLDTPMEEIYNVTTAELKNDIVSEAVMKSFFEKHAILRSLKKTSVDNIVGHISLVFELVYDRSLEIVKEQGYLFQIMNFKSDREETAKQLELIKDFMLDYLKNKC